MITDNDIKQTIANVYPEDMRYAKARPLRVGSGRTKRSLPRRIGRSKNSLLSVEMIGPKTAVRFIKIMSFASGENIDMTTAVILALAERANPGFIGTLEDGKLPLIEGDQKVEAGPVTMSTDMIGNVPILFATVKMQ